MRIILTLIVLFSGLQAAYCAELELEKKEALVQLLGELNQTLEKGDADLFVNSFPPRFYEALARESQRTSEEMVLELKQIVMEGFENKKIISYHFNSDMITYHEMKIGGFYALVPTRLERQDKIEEFSTLALYDDENWYFIHGTNIPIHSDFLLEIYPYLTEISILPAKITSIEKQ